MVGNEQCQRHLWVDVWVIKRQYKSIGDDACHSEQVEERIISDDVCNMTETFPR